MLDRLVDFFRWLMSPRPVRLAIVRRYVDANRNYVGELYMDNGKGSYGMIGASLDSLTLDTDSVDVGAKPYVLDTKNDFLADMPANRIRVGAIDPKDNDAVRAMVARLPKRKMTVSIRNGFIESVDEVKA